MIAMKKTAIPINYVNIQKIDTVLSVFLVFIISYTKVHSKEYLCET